MLSKDTRALLLSEIEKIVEEQPSEEQKENISDTLNIINLVLSMIADFQNPAAAAALLEKISNVTFATLQEFKEELAATETLWIIENGQEQPVTDEDRLQIAQIAEWLAQLKENAENKLSGVPSFVFTPADKEKLVSMIQGKIVKINAVLFKHAALEEEKWDAEKAAVFQRPVTGEAKWYVRKQRKDKINKELSDLKLSLDNRLITQENFDSFALQLKNQRESLQDFSPANNVDEKDSEGNTALIRAVIAGNLVRARELIGQGAALNIKNSAGKTALIFAAEKGYTEIIEELLAKGADPDIQDNTGKTALIHVITANYFHDSHFGKVSKMVKALLAKGADPDIRDKANRTVLDYTIYQDSAEKILKHASKNYIEHLLSEGHALEELPYYLKTPNTLKKLMLYAIKKNRIDIMMSIIEAHGEEKLTFLTEPPMIQAVCRCLKKDTSSPSVTGLSILEKICNMNPSLSFRSKKFAEEIDTTKKQYLAQTEAPFAILAAVNESDFSALQNSIKKSPATNLNIKDNNGRTLLDIAYTKKLVYQLKEFKSEEAEEIKGQREQNEKIFQFLLKKSDINARTLNNQTLLHIAVIDKAPLSDIVLFLLKGLNPQARDKAGKRPIDYLLDKQGQLKDDDMVHVKNILERGMDYLLEPENATILQGVLQSWQENNAPEKYNAIHTLLRDAQDNEGNTVLLRSIKKKNTSLAKHLIEQGVNINLKNKKGGNALLLAAENGQTEIVKLLLAKGVHPDSQNNTEFTALMLAARKRHSEIVKILLAHGADPDIQRSGFFVHNAVSEAAMLNHSEIVNELVAGGAQKGLDKWNSTGALNISPYYEYDKIEKTRIRVSTAKDYIHVLLKEGHPLEELPYILKYPVVLEKLAVYALQQRRPDIIIDIINNHAEKSAKLTFLTKEPLLQDILNYLRDNTLSSPLYRLAILQKIKNIDTNKQVNPNITAIEGSLQKEANLYKFIQQHSVVKSNVVKKPSQERTITGNLPTFFNNKIIITSRLLDAVNKNNFLALNNIIENNPNANINIKDDEGRTLLDIAYTNFLACRPSEAGLSDTKENNQKTSEEILGLLLEKSDANSRTVDNQTLLHLAIGKAAQPLDIVLFLLAGADPQVRDKANKRPIDYLLDENNKLRNPKMIHHKNLLEQGINYLWTPKGQVLLKSMLNNLAAKTKEPGTNWIISQLEKATKNANVSVTRHQKR